MGFMVKRIEDQRGFTRPGDPGHHGQPIAEFNVNVLEVMLAGAFNPDVHGDLEWGDVELPHPV